MCKDFTDHGITKLDLPNPVPKRYLTKYVNFPMSTPEIQSMDNELVRNIYGFILHCNIISSIIFYVPRRLKLRG